MLNIELAQSVEQQPCQCCGRTGATLTRFVYRDGDAYAIYKAVFTDGHPDRVVLITAVFGPWDDDSTSDQRTAFAFRIAPAPNRHEVHILNASDSPWRDSELFRRTLDRDEALAHALLPDVYALADRMIVPDQPLRDYLEAGAA